MKQISHGRDKNQERLVALQKSIKNKEECDAKAIERAARQNKIAEEAQNDHQDMEEVKTRENIMTQKVWATFFRKKMDREMGKYKKIEDSFQKITQATGNSDVKEFVYKFMTKENTYVELLNKIAEQEKRYNELKAQNAERQERLSQLKIDNDNKKPLETDEDEEWQKTRGT